MGTGCILVYSGMNDRINAVIMAPARSPLKLARAARMEKSISEFAANPNASFLSLNSPALGEERLVFATVLV